MLIKVFDLIGDKNALSMDKGEKVYKAIRESIDNEKNVEVDFEGVQIFATLFFNTAIGKLLKDYHAEDLNDKIKFINLTDNGKNLVRKSIKNSAEYYNNTDLKNAVDKVINEEN
ncbi:STAS-like domain-containing protein [Paraliobacillus salinarum]|uniref:STAS-like domain-containing protein n=1 Tax=Paraliobacillus salinarum TaxID=1158996 RepID=UPI0015F3580F|nr:STAS-like domain-containing protein [Paraliobacillus salinarum]